MPMEVELRDEIMKERWTKLIPADSIRQLTGHLCLFSPSSGAEVKTNTEKERYWRSQYGGSEAS